MSTKKGNATSAVAVATEINESKAQLIPIQGGKSDQEATPERKMPTIEELKNRATVLTLLNQKHDELIEKRKRLERFAIVHDTQNAQITVVDANGEEFESSSPKSIGRLIEFWKDEFAEAISENEAKIKSMFE